jgi:hypothetical protein
LCGCVSFFGVAGKLIWFEYLTVIIVSQKYRELKKKIIIIPYKTYVREDQLFLALYGSTTIQSLLFLKNIENFVWFPKQYLLGFTILEKQLANILDRGFLFLRNTLFLYSLLLWQENWFSMVYTLLLYSLDPYRQTEWQTEKQIHSLCVGWRNLFSRCAVVLCQFLVLVGKRFWSTYACTIQSTIKLWWCVSYLVLVGNSFWCYAHT